MQIDDQNTNPITIVFYYTVKPLILLDLNTFSSKEKKRKNNVVLVVLVNPLNKTKVQIAMNLSSRGN